LSFRVERSGNPDKSAQRVERPEGGPQGERSESSRGFFTMGYGFPLSRE
jgi:hypothetical protein